MSFALHKIDVFPVYKLRRRSFETKKGGFFSSITTTILSKTCSSLNLRKVCPMINSYFLHMVIFIERLALQGQSYYITIFSKCVHFS